MLAGCSLVGRGDWVFSDVYAWEPLRGTVFPAGAEGPGRPGCAVCSRGIFEFAELAAGEYSSPRAAIFSAGIGQESHGAGLVLGTADGALERESFAAVWGELSVDGQSQGKLRVGRAGAGEILFHGRRSDAADRHRPDRFAQKWVADFNWLYAAFSRHDIFRRIAADDVQQLLREAK